MGKIKAARCFVSRLAGRPVREIQAGLPQPELVSGVEQPIIVFQRPGGKLKEGSVFTPEKTR